MQEQMIEQKSVGKIDILWIVLKAFVGFAFIRMVTSGIKIFPAPFGDAFSVAVFTYWIYQNFKKAAQKEGYTLSDCRVTKPLLTYRDILFVLGFLFLHYGIMSLGADRVIWTGQSLWDIILVSMPEIFHSGIGSGLNEEIVFRGYLVKVLEDKIGIAKAIIVSSIVFGLGHTFNGGMTLRMVIWFTIGTGIIGAMFAVITYETGTIWRAVLTHACVNLSGLIIQYETGNSLLILDFPVGATIEQIFCTSYTVSSAVCMIVICWYWIRRVKNRNVGV